jgi:hypothetical protein
MDEKIDEKIDQILDEKIEENCFRGNFLKVTFSDSSDKFLACMNEPKFLKVAFTLMTQRQTCLHIFA